MAVMKIGESLQKPHPGSWSIGNWQLPDFGATEAATGQWGAGRTTLQGGSDFIPNQPVPSGPTGASRDFGTPTPQPTYQPTPQPRPAPQPQPTGGFDWAEYQRRGWTDYSAAQADAAATGGPGAQQGDQAAQMRQIDEMYNMSIQGLNQLYSQIKTQDLPTALQGLETQRGQLSRQLETSQEETAAEFGRQQTAAESMKRSALSEATRAYNSATQRAMATYGAGSSAGPMISEIISREWLRGRGTISQNWNKTISKIFTERTRLYKYVADKKLEIQENFAQKINEVNNDFKRQLIQVDMEKAATEQAKSAAKLNVLQETIKRTSDIRDAMAIAEGQFEIWTRQVDYEADEAISWLNTEVTNFTTNPEYQQGMASIQFPGLPSTELNVQRQQQQQQFLASRPEGSDELFQDLINPFA